jgi:hypothetical protein
MGNEATTPDFVEALIDLNSAGYRNASVCIPGPASRHSGKRPSACSVGPDRRNTV